MRHSSGDRRLGRVGAAWRSAALVAITVTTIGVATALPAPAAPPLTFTAAGASPAHASSGLVIGQTLRAGSTLTSPDGFVTLRLQSDGNLVARAGGRVLFASGTRGPGHYAQVDRSGDFAIFDAAHHKVWATHTTGNTNRLRVDDSGNLVLANRIGRIAWNSRTRANELDGGNTLRAGQVLTSSRGDRLIQQTDGNLVLRRADGRVTWNSATGGHPGAVTRMQGDGNLVVYSSTHQALWQSGRAGGGAKALLGSDGALVVRRANNTIVWSSTAKRAVTPAPARRPTTAAGYASAILKMWGGRVTGLPGARSDLLAASRNQAIDNGDSCGRTVRVDIRIVKFLYDVTLRYKIKINNIITGHGCDSGRHPKGMATDIGGAWSLATGAATSFGGFWGPNNTSLDTQFAAYASQILPAGSGLGQRYCAGTSSARLKPGIAFFADNCNHQHIQV